MVTSWMPPGGHKESPDPPLPRPNCTPSLPPDPQAFPQELPRHLPKELRLLLLKLLLPLPLERAEQAELTLKPLWARQGESDMAGTQSHKLQTEESQGVRVPALRPSTRLLSPPLPGLGLGEQDALGLTVSVTGSS